jgi:hypothetical protein
MRTVHDLIKEARHLSAEDRRRLVETLEESLAEGDAPQRATGRGNPCGRTLSLAGTFHSDFEDVSSDKYKHLSQASLDRHSGR